MDWEPDVFSLDDVEAPRKGVDLVVVRETVVGTHLLVARTVNHGDVDARDV